MDIRAFGDGGELREAPQEFVLLRKGQNRFTINGKQSEFTLNDEDAAKIIKEFNDRNKDVVVDWDHSTLNKQASSIGDAPAAGWARLEQSPDGIIAKVINWSKKAKERLCSGEYRYFSPVINFMEGKPCAIQSVGLTNHPAIHSQMPLVAANDILDTTVVIDENLDNVLNGYEAMGRRLKSTIGELQAELKNVFTGMSDLAINNPIVERRVQSFNDALFAEELQAFADDYITDQPTLESVTLQVNSGIKQGKTVDGVLAEVETNRRDTLQSWKRQVDVLEAEYSNKLLNTPVTQQANLNTIINWLRGEAVKIQDGINQIPKVETVESNAGILPLADLSEDVATQTILDYIKKILESVPTMKGEVLKRVGKELNTITNLASAVKDVVDVVQEQVAVPGVQVSTPPSPVYAAMNDMGLQNCSNDDELIKAVGVLKKEREKAKLESEASASKLVALNDAMLTLKAEKVVDSVIYRKHGKITEGMRKWAIQFARKDPKGFEDYVENSPVAFSDLKLPKEDILLKKKPYSVEQLRIATLFGNKPEDVYE